MASFNPCRQLHLVGIVFHFCNLLIVFFFVLCKVKKNNHLLRDMSNQPGCLLRYLFCFVVVYYSLWFVGLSSPKRTILIFYERLNDYTYLGIISRYRHTSDTSHSYHAIKIWLWSMLLPPCAVLSKWWLSIIDVIVWLTVIILVSTWHSWTIIAFIWLLQYILWLSGVMLILLAQWIIYSLFVLIEVHVELILHFSW